MREPLWSTAQLAKLMDLHIRRIGQLVDEGIIEKAERGKFNPMKANVAYIRHLRQRNVKGAPDLESESKTRQSLNRERLAQIKIQNETLLRRRIAIDEIKTVLDAGLGSIASQIKSRAGKVLDQSALADLFAEIRETGKRIEALYTKPAESINIADATAIPTRGRKKKEKIQNE